MYPVRPYDPASSVNETRDACVSMQIYDLMSFFSNAFCKRRRCLPLWFKVSVL